MYGLVGGKADEKVHQNNLYRPLFVAESRVSEETVMSLFKEDTGLAYQLLGQLNRCVASNSPAKHCCLVSW